MTELAGYVACPTIVVSLGSGAAMSRFVTRSMCDVDFAPSTYWKYWLLSRGGRAERLRSKELFWAWEYVEDMVRVDPLLAVGLLVELALEAPGAEALAFLGAGPIETLLRSSSDDARELFVSVVESCPELAEAWKSSW
jgi:hypothetical protein